MTRSELEFHFLAFDLKRLDSYAHNLVDHYVIADLVPPLARLYFQGRAPVSLSAGQTAILLSGGLQSKSFEETAQELTLPINQVMALFNKSIRKFSQHFQSIMQADIAAKLPESRADLGQKMSGLTQDLDEELASAIDPSKPIPSVISIPKKQKREGAEVEGGDSKKKKKHSSGDSNNFGNNNSAKKNKNKQKFKKQKGEKQ
jgi:hypothetical protein